MKLKERKQLLERLQSFGSYEEIMKMLDKQIPQRPYNIVFDTELNGKVIVFRGGCPICGNIKVSRRDITYCDICGQKLDWRSSATNKSVSKEVMEELKRMVKESE